MNLDVRLNIQLKHSRLFFNLVSMEYELKSVFVIYLFRH